VRNVKTDFFTDRGAVQPAGLSNQPARDYCWVKSDKAGRALARLLSSPQVGRAIPTPGVAMVSAQVANEWHVAQARVVTVTLIGPPASITVAAAPAVVTAGEAVTVTVTLKDAIGQNVWDGHKVRLTGGTFQDSEPITFGGVATAFLHTVAPGVYTVVGTAQPTLPGWPPISALVTVTAK